MPSYANPSIPIKACEIRSWRWPYEIPFTIAIHASSDDSIFATEFDYVWEKSWDAYYAFDNPEVEVSAPGRDYFYASVVIGLVDVIGCIEIDPAWKKKDIRKRILDAGLDEYYAEWAKPPYALILANPRRLEQGIYVPGKQKIWELPENAIEHINATEFFGPPQPCVDESETPQCQPLPLKPVGVAKCLGKPNYAEITRQAEKRLKQS